jgi:hypothetical protein
MNGRLAALTMGGSLVFAGWPLPATSTAASASTVAAPSDTCSLSHLSVTVPSASASGGTEGMLIAFRNKGSSTCDLQGYPKVVATRPGASFSALATTSTYLGGLNPGVTPPRVSLKPGSIASAVVAAGDTPVPSSSRCVHEHYKTVRISLPGQSGTKALSAKLPREATSLPSCSRVEVTPFQSGLIWFGN